MKIYNQDCLYKLKELKDNSVDSIVTDPPYGLSFMGKKWDYDVPSVEIWVECLRVLKSGGHLLSFAGSRTYHRMAVRIEDAGFEIRDQIMWIYGSGFPKSHNIGKSVDKLLGNEREAVGHYTHPNGSKPRNAKSGFTSKSEIYHNDEKYGIDGDKNRITTKGTSPYEGWGTALKPAHEPIVMARKPFKGTVVNNVLEWGTGGINIDASRVGTDDTRSKASMTALGQNSGWNKHSNKEVIAGSESGRFPSNIILDKEAGKILDQQSGVSKSSNTKRNRNTIGSFGMPNDKTPEYSDKGGASRFFYCPKTSKRDRNEGVDNNHPTVKPTDLMLYLIRLVTPKGGITLDPFMGSGSTGKAAIRGGFDFIGIEREKEYIDIAKARIKYEQENQKPDQQQKLF